MYLLEWQHLSGSSALPPYPFSIGWFDCIFKSLTTKRRSASGNPVSLGFSASVVLPEDLQFVEATLPTSIKTLLSKPPVMQKYTGDLGDKSVKRRRCRRCRSLESDGFHDRLCQALAASSATNSFPILNVLCGITQDMQLRPRNLHKRTIIFPLVSLLSRGSQDEQRKSFPPEFQQFLSCSLLNQ